MHIHCILRPALCVPLLLSLRDGNQACATASDATQVSLNSSALDDTESAAEPGVSDVAKNIREAIKSEDRMIDVEALLRSAPYVSDAVKGFRASGLKEPLGFSTLSSHTYMNHQAEEIVRSADELGVSDLAARLKSNQLLGSGSARENADMAIRTTLFARTPEEVAKELLLLRVEKDMESEAEKLHRQFIVELADHPNVVSGAWEKLGLNPNEVLKGLGLHKTTTSSSSDFEAAESQWRHYINLYVKNHPKSSKAEDWLDPIRRGGRSHDYSRGIAIRPGHVSSPNMPINHHSDANTFADRLKSLRPASDTSAVSKDGQMLTRIEEFTHFAKKAIWDVKSFASLLDRHLKKSEGSGFVTPDEVIKVLMSHKTLTDVVRLLVSLHQYKYQQATATELHKILIRRIGNPDEMCAAWIIQALRPETLNEYLGVKSMNANNHFDKMSLNAYLNYDARYKKEFQRALRGKNAAKDVAPNKGAEELDFHIEDIDNHPDDLARLPHNVFDGMSRKQQTKDAGVHSTYMGGIVGPRRAGVVMR
ncbi:unnamed protein product [Hyaloperonospora brassicae]|uniref:RxLR effector candidate protein n=1 Tax=Hyaloperonospora brassicae TaxID=162125 RepID=A0AAV0UR12_HYABA|nr:unnamed protein product [Hyaloperonospora brassicae]